MIERLRRKSETEAHRQGMAEAVGLQNAQILDVLQEMGFDRNTVVLIFLVPLLEVAWSDGSVSDDEREGVLRAARAQRVGEGTAAHEKLISWLATRPDPVASGWPTVVLMIFFSVKFPALYWKAVAVTLACDGASHQQSTLFFTTDTLPDAASDRSLSLPLNCDGTPQVLTFDFGQHPAWSGTITGLRLDPVSEASDDFQVDELPAYDPCGSGDHVYVWIEKAGITTTQAILDMAAALGIASSTIGAAGRKDARGVTRQVVSVAGVEPSRIRALDLPRIRILDVARHRSKLRPGSLRGNRFTIKLQDVSTGRIGEVQEVLRVLAARGVPNYFGPQRFGMRGDTGEIGRCLLAGDLASAVKLIVGEPAMDDPALVGHARALAAAGQYGEAAKAWPPGFADCAHLCRALERARGDTQRAIFSLDRSVLGFYVSAYQAWLFNRVLAARDGGLDRFVRGDIAYSHRTGL